MKDELTTIQPEALTRNNQPAYTPVLQVHPDYSPEEAQRTCAKQWCGLFGTLTFIAVVFPVLFREIPPPEVLIVSLIGVAIMATIGYQIGFIWGSPVVRTCDYSTPDAPASTDVAEDLNLQEEEPLSAEKSVAEAPLQPVIQETPDASITTEEAPTPATAQSKD
jgi:hypothetical protein